jgi:hypothetical protein
MTFPSASAEQQICHNSKSWQQPQSKSVPIGRTIAAMQVSDMMIKKH